jgi:hypothetical protein
MAYEQGERTFISMLCRGYGQNGISRYITVSEDVRCAFFNYPLSTLIAFLFCRIGQIWIRKEKRALLKSLTFKW